jgi:hypothetical protein
MLSPTSFAIICAAGAVLFGLGRAILAALSRAGQDAERAQQADRDLRAMRRQSKVMLEHREPQDVANDMDAGDF